MATDYETSTEELHSPDSWCRSIRSSEGARQCCNDRTLPLGGDTWTPQRPVSSARWNDRRVQTVFPKLRLWQQGQAERTQASHWHGATCNVNISFHSEAQLHYKTDWSDSPCVWRQLRPSAGKGPSPCDCSHRPPSAASCDHRRTCPSWRPPDTKRHQNEVWTITRNKSNSDYIFNIPIVI